MTIYCPIGSKYKYWPEFTIENLESVGPAINLYPTHLEVDSSKIALNLDPQTWVYQFPINMDAEGLNIKVLFTNVNIANGGLASNYHRTVGFNLGFEDDDFEVGIWFGDRTNYNTNRVVWVECTVNNIIANIYSNGPHEILAELEVLSSAGGENYNAKMTMTFISGPYQGTSVSSTKTVRLRNPSTSLKMFLFNEYSHFFDYSYTNTCEVNYVWIYSPNLTGEDCRGYIWADFIGTPVAAVCPATVYFTDLSQAESGVNAWLWDFGDGNTSTDQNPTHEYTRPGRYTVSLTVTNPDGTDTKTEVAYIVLIGLDFDAIPKFGKKPLLVRFYQNLFEDGL